MIFRTLHTLLFFILFIATPSVTKAQVTVTATFENCSAVDSFILYESQGLFKSKVTVARANANGTINFTVPTSKFPKFYFLGLNIDLEHHRTLLLGTENNVKLTGPCYNMQLISIQNSKVNDDYVNVMNNINNLKIEMNSVVQEYQREYYNESKRKELEEKMRIVDTRKIALLDSLKKANPTFGRIAGLDTYTSYQNSAKKAAVKDEIEYFATQYFQYVNWQDTMYNHIPYIYDMFRSYAQVISMKELGLSREQQKTYYNTILKSIPAKKQAYKYALTGILSILMEKQSPVFVDMGDRYLSEFPNEDPTMLANFSMMLNQARSQMIDVPAPDIAMTDTTLTNILRLSDLKGKYVLVDFWASWCGPCRRENPNVVRLYHKYKNKGFDIFSVSLDQQRDRWIKAIQDDGLLWSNHVSDLKFWQNEAARMYAVTSIPRTVLLDKNGIIIARDLRGPALEDKLREVFGE
jgi:thiol-disulfide isomerase/thioredoxin